MNSVTSPADTLPQEIDAFHLLRTLLEQEQAHLIEADVSGLENVLVQKAEVVARLSGLASARHHALAELGLAPEEASMPQWLAGESENNKAAKQLWSELLELTQSTKEINNTNGLLIGSNMSRNQNALQILHSSSSAGNTYGSDGRPDIKSSSRNYVVG